MAKKKIETPATTEEKIKEAARKVFMRKGFSATRTRDIAEEAGINLALLNYYFRSKQRLFEEVMQEKIQKLLGTLVPIMNDAELTLEEKIEGIVSHYIDVLSANPDLPMFVLNELGKNNFSIVKNANLDKVISQSSFVKQLRERRNDLNPVHFIISIFGMIIFPFVARPMMFLTGMTNEKSFILLMNERKALVPVWAKAMLKAK
ncbi:MAG: TetR/AcrR family transcriptional regulator [Cyclobacteriaceae bacterium]|nr:TetR/AcrR family transcriptional regulator [Cyclobacteriaceae bacterium]